ncbi:hypothetical protein Q3G72_015822 [Acer saccharum]|nr:hypothetical protein Q3G72_015822 [Acer saccharum]
MKSLSKSGLEGDSVSTCPAAHCQALSSTISFFMLAVFLELGYRRTASCRRDPGWTKSPFPLGILGEHPKSQSESCSGPVCPRGGAAHGGPGLSSHQKSPPPLMLMVSLNVGGGEPGLLESTLSA